MPRGCRQRHQPHRKTSQKVTRRQNKAQTAGWNRNSRRRELWLTKFVSQNWRPVFVQKNTLPQGDYIIKAREKTGKSLQKWKVGYKIWRSLSKCETRLQNGKLGWLLSTATVWKAFSDCFTTKKGRFTTSQFIVKKDMPKEKIKRNHVIQIFRKRISEY